MRGLTSKKTARPSRGSILTSKFAKPRYPFSVSSVQASSHREGKSSVIIATGFPIMVGAWSSRSTRAEPMSVTVPWEST